MPFESIPGTPAGILILRAMKAERLALLLDSAVWDESLLVQIPRETFELLLRYILAGNIDKDAFESKIRGIGDRETQSKAMTLAQQYHQEGLQKGRQEGCQKNVIEILEIRFGHVPDDLKRAVFAISEETELLELLRTVIEIDSLEAFRRVL